MLFINKLFLCHRNIKPEVHHFNHSFEVQGSLFLVMSKKVRMDINAQKVNFICCTLINSGEAVATSINCFLWTTWLLFMLISSSGRMETFFVS